MFDAEFTNRGKERNLEKMRANESGSTPQQSVFVEEKNPADGLVPKKKSTAYVWNYFGFRRSEVLQRQVLCKT